MKDSWWKRGLLAAQKRKGALLQQESMLQQRLYPSFDVFLLMRVIVSSFSSVGKRPPVIKLAGEQKLGAGCNDSPCCPVSIPGQIYCSRWSQLNPPRSSTALLQPYVHTYSPTRCLLLIHVEFFLGSRLTVAQRPQDFLVWGVHFVKLSLHLSSTVWPLFCLLRMT